MLQECKMALRNMQHEAAAQMIAADTEPDHRIAAMVGVSRRTIAYWKKRPDVQARVQKIVTTAAQRLEAHIERHSWLWERECCLRALESKSLIARRVALEQLREMGALSSETQRQVHFSTQRD
jgi:Putative ATPase subunit of terminase (gpP-like)